MKKTRIEHNCKISVCPGASCPECEGNYRALYNIKTKKIDAEMCAGCLLELFDTLYGRSDEATHINIAARCKS